MNHSTGKRKQRLSTTLERAEKLHISWKRRQKQPEVKRKISLNTFRFPYGIQFELAMDIQYLP